MADDFRSYFKMIAIQQLNVDNEKEEERVTKKRGLDSSNLLFSNTHYTIAEVRSVINRLQDNSDTSAQENHIWQCVGNIGESNQEEAIH